MTAFDARAQRVEDDLKRCWREAPDPHEAFVNFMETLPVGTEITKTDDEIIVKPRLMQDPMTCDACGGTGGKFEKCWSCSGTGEIRFVNGPTRWAFPIPPSPALQPLVNLLDESFDFGSTP